MSRYTAATVHFHVATKGFQELAAAVQDTIAAMLLSEWLVNSEPVVSGLEARFYVRAGFDPTCTTEAQLRDLVRTLLTQPELATSENVHSYLTSESRARLATAALSGWVNHRQQDNQEALAWHRMIGTKRLQVGRQL